MPDRRVHVLAAALVAVGLAAAACSSDPPSPDPMPATPSRPAVALPSPSTPSSTPPSSAQASAATGILPESVLARVKPYTYSPIPGSENTVPPEIEQLATYFEGYVGRQVELDGKVRGTVQLLRAKAGALGAGAAGDKVLEEFLKGFSGATSFDRREVGKTEVLVARVPGSTATVAGWRSGTGGRDLILLLSAPSLSPTDFARGYLAA